jgi:hypothetical protein
MATRALFSFLGGIAPVNVYKHYDGYPEGAASALVKALEVAWALPRYEADEFAAAFVAANKREAGGVRLAPSAELPAIWEQYSDIAFAYEFMQARNGQMIVRAYAVGFDDETQQPVFHVIFYGRFKEFLAMHGTEADKVAWDQAVPSPRKLEDHG